MILFLNFAPIEYLGGAERKTYELFSEVRKKEKAVIYTSSFSLARLYGKIIGINFENRNKGELSFSDAERKFISLKSFLFFTSEFRKIQREFHEARIIYIKCEINEFFLVIWFGGVSALKKVIAAVYSPWVYQDPISFLDHLHNFLYKSRFIRTAVSKLKTLHVLTLRDKEFFQNTFNLRNVMCIPNYSESVTQASHAKRNVHELRIVFIGELLLRKGVDILIDVIGKSPLNFHFDIIGRGPMQDEIMRLSQTHRNVTYHGYLQRKEIDTILSSSDVLFLPSRAEVFPSVILEALSHGLVILDSPYINLSLPKDIEYTPHASSPSSYLTELNTIEKHLKSTGVNKQKIVNFYTKNFEKKIVMQKMMKLFI